jgi:hypothetical protein
MYRYQEVEVDLGIELPAPEAAVGDGATVTPPFAPLPASFGGTDEEEDASLGPSPLRGNV